MTVLDMCSARAERDLAQNTGSEIARAVFEKLPELDNAGRCRLIVETLGCTLTQARRWLAAHNQLVSQPCDNPSCAKPLHALSAGCRFRRRDGGMLVFCCAACMQFATTPKPETGT